MMRWPDRPLRARPCICGKHMFERVNEGICLWCGHGMARAVRELAYARNMVAVDPELDRRLFARRLFARDGERARREQRRGRGPAPRWTAEACVEAARVWEQTYGHLPHSDEWRRSGDGHPAAETIRAKFGGWPAFMREIADVPRELDEGYSLLRRAAQQLDRALATVEPGQGPHVREALAALHAAEDAALRALVEAP